MTCLNLLQAVLAGGFSRETPASPMVQQVDTPQIFCKVPGPDAMSQQIVMELWPSLLLHNQLACPLQWRMSHADHSLGKAPFAPCMRCTAVMVLTFGSDASCVTMV